MTDSEPAPHVFNASMGARLEALYASQQIVDQRRRFRNLLGACGGESGVDVGCGLGHLTCELAEDVGAERPDDRRRRERRHARRARRPCPRAPSGLPRRLARG